VARRLVAAGVEAVALAMVDPAGVTRVKCIPIRRFEEVARFGVGLSNVFSVFLVNDDITSSPGIEGPSGDTRLVPDPASAVALAASPGWALAAVDQRDQEGDPWPPCGRTFARRILERLAGHGLELRGGYELEFFLGKRGSAHEADEPDPIPAHTGPGYSAPVLADQEPFATEVIRALEAQGTGVMQFHPEYSTGQFEISVPHRVGIGLADTNLVARHTIRAVARSNGLAVSFAPVVFAGLVGNGDHLHLSLWDRRGRNRFANGDGPEGMTRDAEAFSAGVLESLPAIVGVSCPSVASYLRLQPHRWAGPWAAWGRENREAGLRFVTGMVGSRPEAANLEIKPVDGSSNPYLVLGAVAAAGLDGLERDLRLPEPTTDDPASIPAAKRRKLGITQLPSSLDAAIGELERSSILREAMGDMLFDSFLATRRGEAEAFAGMDDDAVARAHRWRY
jgi:glutamine synthetase